jgi:LysM repeat protein
MIARVGGELDKLIKQTASAPASGGAYGIEHTVRPGETLSTIATAYGVQVKTLIEVNKIQNPNVLSVGQKLFIPE